MGDDGELSWTRNVKVCLVFSVPGLSRALDFIPLTFLTVYNLHMFYIVGWLRRVNINVLKELELSNHIIGFREISGIYEAEFILIGVYA